MLLSVTMQVRNLKLQADLSIQRLLIAGRHLWRKHFLGRTQVGWDEFVSVLCEMFMTSVPTHKDVHWRCLKAMLVKGVIDDPGTRKVNGTVLSALFTCLL